ncbi:hypothetical protein [Phycicoccus sp. Soil802]|uniref:hypothetical protein n=1 Tax=Phycicoccus sp. Soil802 TaxID=1736414 RepID=UPI000702B254|nr:hypothetical protein [Phycicoccus sp. Soil802]KRF22913.1 hypothetical protein ASG91_16195 [Phycicoccus sp. Soil802]
MTVGYVFAGFVIGAVLGLGVGLMESSKFQAAGVVWACLAVLGISGVVGAVQTVQHERQAFCDSGSTVPGSTSPTAGPCSDLSAGIKMLFPGSLACLAGYWITVAIKRGND